MLFAFAAEAVHENFIAIFDAHEDLYDDDDDYDDDDTDDDYDDNCDVKNGQVGDDVWVVL